jgi:hypothetical protein
LVCESLLLLGCACGPGHFFHTAGSVFYVFRFQKHARGSDCARIAQTEAGLYSYAAKRRCARSQTRHNYRLANSGTRTGLRAWFSSRSTKTPSSTGTEKAVIGSAPQHPQQEHEQKYPLDQHWSKGLTLTSLKSSAFVNLRLVMVPMNSRRTIRPEHIERSREIYKAIAADAAACGLTPKQFADRFMEQGVRELRKLNWISRRAAR